MNMGITVPDAGLIDSAAMAQSTEAPFVQLMPTLAAPGSALWAFSKNQDGVWQPTTTIPLSEEDGALLADLIEQLENDDDVHDVYTNAA